MTEDQLNTARAAQWHQNASPLLTLDDAKTWLDLQGLCLFLPRRVQLPSPAPSFVEACLGQTAATPPRPAIETATELMVRLTAEGHLVPLNLLGMLSEQPDFLVTQEALTWVAAIRGERDWKSAPAGRTAPLLVEIWKQLEQNGAMEAGEIRTALGREVTEAAVLRALVELWGGLRVIPRYEAGRATAWNLLKAEYPKQLAAGANTSQITALSALISLYLQAAIAATGEETEIFLSPLTARSRIREVVHGLTATRQIGAVSLGTQTLLHIAGALPEFAEPEAQESEAPAASDSGTAPEAPRLQRTSFDRRPPRPVRKEKQDEGSGFRPKRFAAGSRESRPGGPKREGRAGGFERPAFGKRPYPPRSREEGQERERTPFRKPFDRPRPSGEGGEEQERRPLGEKKFFGNRGGKPGGRPAGKFGPKLGAKAGGRPGSGPGAKFGSKFGSASGGRPDGGRPRPPREGGEEQERRPFGERKPFGAPTGKRTERPGGRPAGRSAPKFGAKPGGRPGARPGAKFGAKPGFAAGGKRDRGFGGGTGEDRPRSEGFGGGFKRPAAGKRFDGPRPPRAPRPDQEGAGRPFEQRKSFGPRPGRSGPPTGKFAGRPGARPFPPRRDDGDAKSHEGGSRPPSRRSFGGGEERPKGEGGERKSFGGARGGFGGKRKPFGDSTGKPRFSKSGTGGASSRTGSRPGGKPGKPGGFGKKKFSPGGSKPFPKSGPRKSGPRKPRREEPGE
ncbi:hypothetical protein [Paracidobacterium acidisoli]|uniref:Uncharacterized protein n=1 Tax=Paracidobacterium acidisoli TaxID=2303751 RepID=A0A372IPI3_9BACT|nr:hypothetical protein [Paracidobacterium acidisoli]MBT9332158.1 hypothetical protein [Paracidobacterium acidisoli]